MPRVCEAPDHVHLNHKAYNRFGYFVVVLGDWTMWYFACQEWLEIIRPQIEEGKMKGWSIRKWKGGKA
ncbi:MAG TPA: hypothetical protein VFK94_03355 [Patescibacteria group bacterium]|nr:hypothetical protein [Patescibacteria group bacterium]